MSFVGRLIPKKRTRISYEERKARKKAYDQKYYARRKQMLDEHKQKQQASKQEEVNKSPNQNKTILLWPCTTRTWKNTRFLNKKLISNKSLLVPHYPKPRAGILISGSFEHSLITPTGHRVPNANRPNCPGKKYYGMIPRLWNT